MTGFELTTRLQAADPAEGAGHMAAMRLAQDARQDHQDNTQHSTWRKGLAEFAGAASASTAGAVVWTLASSNGYGLPLKILGAAAASGATRVGVQGGLEHLLVKPEERTPLMNQFAWGVVDGFSGVAGAAADSAANKSLLRGIGRSYLGPVGDGEALSAGVSAVSNSLKAKFEWSIGRGVAAGAVGSLAWSVPHALYDNRKHLDSASGWAAAGKTVGFNTAFGAVTGGVISGAITAVSNARDIYGYAAARLKGDEGVTRLDLIQLNDLHAQIAGKDSSLPQIATKVDELRASSAEKGRTALFTDAGDNSGKGVAANFTNTGYVETKAINQMGVDAFIPGNHVADKSSGNKTDVESWVRNIQQISKEMNRELPALGANIEVPKHPDFIGPEGQVYKPFRLHEIIGPNGQKDVVAEVGLITDGIVKRAGDGEVRYLDAQKEAQRWVDYIRKPTSEGGLGINKVVVLSHLGRPDDIELAQNIKGISAIIGAHDHIADPAPVWVSNKTTGWQVPIFEAGSRGNYVGEMNLAFTADGAADKYRSFGRLHLIDSAVKPHPEVQRFIQEAAPQVVALDNMKYKATVTEPFAGEGRINQVHQTELGTLIAKADLEGANRHLPEINATRAANGLKPLEPMTIMLKDSSELEVPLHAGTPSKYDLSNLFYISGNAELERKELFAVQLSGKDIKDVLNFSVGEMSQPKGYVEEAAQRVFALPAQPEAGVALSAHKGPRFAPILSTEGLAYSVDLSQPAGSRISNIKVFNPETQAFMPVEADKAYNVLTHARPLQMWSKRGVLDGHIQVPGVPTANIKLDAQPIALSQIDLLGEHMERQGIVSPAQYRSSNITDLTPRPSDGSMAERVPLTISLGALSWFRSQNAKE